LINKSKEKVLEGIKFWFETLPEALQIKNPYTGENFHFFFVPRTLLTDEGREFNNNLLKNYLQKRGVRLLHVYPDKHLGIVERFNRTLKSLLTHELLKNKYFGISVPFQETLSNVVALYNNTVHSSIKMRPVLLHFLFFNYPDLLRIAREGLQRYTKKKQPKFKEGDKVLVSITDDPNLSYGEQRKKRRLDTLKRLPINWTEKVYTILDLITYPNGEIKYLLKEVPDRTFYENQLIRVS
jgi:hypothetical protein